jgi:hypothetical protein
MLVAMNDKPRYQMRTNGAALTRFQWWSVGTATLVTAVGAFLALTRGTAFGATLMCLSSLVVLFTLISATGRSPAK